jgi:hypothetical protein
MIPLKHLDPIAVLQIWGESRCFVHDDILSALNITWNAESQNGI